MNTIVRTEGYFQSPGTRSSATGRMKLGDALRMDKTNHLNLEPFDASDYLDSDEAIAEYLRAALENPDPDAFLVAVRDVAKAQGIATVAASAGLGRESLYKALKPGAQPRFDTVRRLLGALGVKLDITHD